MRAITVIPGTPGSARLDDMPEPPADESSLRVQTLALGVCGTDIEIVAGAYGWPPPGHERLILGHEAIGRVLDAPASSEFHAGELVVGIVRRPDPVPCSYCAIGEWDMCSNGQYTERGIKQLDGYGSECFRLDPDFAVKVDPALGPLGVLVEPTSVVAKAWDQIAKISERSRAWAPKIALVTGAGPIGLLAALIARQRGLELHVFDRAVEGPKLALVRDLGGTYHSGDLSALDTLAPDIIVECTGAPAVIAGLLTRAAPSGIVCLTGVSPKGRAISVDLGAVNREMVLENNVIFGCVNANRSHYRAAAAVLAKADPKWLARLITRRVPLADWRRALHREPDDVKVVVDFGSAS